MKIMGPDFNIRDIQRGNALGPDMDHPILLLQWPFDGHKSAARHHHPILLERIRREDNVGYACLVLKRQKHEALGRSGPLPRNHAARHPHILMIWQARQVVR